jgi:hypothetical protein
MKFRLPIVIRDQSAGASAITPTPDEQVWWREASKPERRRIFSIWMPWYMGAITLPVMVHDPSAFFGGGKWKYLVPLAIVSGLIAATLLWKTSSPGLLRRSLVGKRMRDALLASADSTSEIPPGRGDS